MNKNILVLGLNHVVSLGSQACHVSVDVDCLFVLKTLQHGVDDDESSSSTHPSTETNYDVKLHFKLEIVLILIFILPAMSYDGSCIWWINGSNSP